MYRVYGKVMVHTVGIDAANLLSMRFFSSSSTDKLRCGLMHAHLSHALVSCIDDNIKLLPRQPVTMQVFSAVQAHDPSCIAPEHLHMALLAWLELNDPTAATSALQRHDALAVNWTAPQQQAVFQDALRFFKASQKDAALPLLQSLCMAGLKAKLPLAPVQAHELVLALLSLGQTQNALQVSIDRLQVAYPRSPL